MHLFYEISERKMEDDASIDIVRLKQRLLTAEKNTGGKGRKKA